MAHDRPWYQRNGSAILMGVMHFPDNDHRWAYSAIIDMLNDRDQAIPDDAAFICGFTRLSRKKWSIVRAYLLAHRNSDGEPDKLVLNKSGDITNPRFERERDARQGKRATNQANGSEGGKKAAANRAAAQGALDLSGDKTADSTPDSGVDSTLDSTPDSALDTPEKVKPASPENNSLTVATPIASRAREPASEDRDKRREEESSTANPRPRVAQAVADDAAFDLLAVTHRLCRLGGVSMVRPTAHAVNMDIVRHWISEGVDIEAIVVPAITAQFRDTRETTIGALSFYGARVAKLHADAVAKNGGRAPSRDWTPDQQAEYLERLNGSSTKPPTKPPDKRGK